MRDDDGYLPIHHLCDNEDLDETASINILRFMLEIDPTLPREVDRDDYLPIHSTAAYKSTTFCKILIDVYPESLQIESDEGLPIHLACRYGDVYVHPPLFSPVCDISAASVTTICVL